MSGVDGRVLRELRERARLGLGRIASRSALPVSVGHLSRVERGQRKVTPAIVAAYEQALGMRITTLVGDGPGRADHIDDLEREAFSATIGKLAAGAAPDEPVDKLLELVNGQAGAPARISLTDVAQVEHAAAMVRRLDLRFGGGLVWQLAEPVLQWTVRLREVSMTEATRARFEVATGALAGAAAWAAFDDGRHRSARALFAVAFDAARRSDDPDLRAHVLADVAAHYNYLGYPEDGLAVLRLAGDERVGSAVESVLHGVRAHVYAARAEAGACARELELAQVTCAASGAADAPRWLAAPEPNHTQAVCGQALAALAGRTGRDADQAQARRWLAGAVDGLAQAGRVRALALCQTRLTMLHLAGADQPEAARWARQALATAAGVRSARVRRDLWSVREVAATRLGDQLSGELATLLTDQIDAPAPPLA